MQAIISYPDSHRTEVLILAAGRMAMRVLPRGSEDIVELNLHYGQWTDETGTPVEFELLVAGEGGLSEAFELPRFFAARVS